MSSIVRAAGSGGSSSSSSIARIRTPEQFGAAGNGTDDTAALTSCLAALQTGETLWLAPGKVYAHTAVLNVTANGVTITGGGEVRATAQATSAFRIAGNYVRVDDVKFTCPTTTSRGSTLNHHKLVLNGCTGASLSRVQIDGSHASGIFAYGATNYLIRDCSVQNTRADGFHNVKASSYGLIDNCQAYNTGDDGFAVVSYASPSGDAGLCHHIRITNCRVETVTAGRGFSIVGGQDIEYTDCFIKQTYAAGLLIASETAIPTYGVARVVCRGFDIREANTIGAGRPNHGAVIIDGAVSGTAITDVTLSDIRILDTDTAVATRNVSLNAVSGTTVSDIVFEDVVLRGTSPAIRFSTSGVVATGNYQIRSTGRRLVRVADLPRPLVIPHRGAGSLLAPENTMDAFLQGASYGLGLVDGGDWNVTSDGALVCIHDSTVDRTTSSSGNVSALTSMRARFLTVDSSTWFGPGFPDTTLPTAEQVFGYLGGTVVLTPEPKSQAAADALAALVKRMGLQESVIPNAFSTAYLAPFVAAGCTDVLLNVTTMPDQPTMDSYTAAGIHWIGIPTTMTSANVTTLVANGFEVMVGTVSRASEATPFAGAAVSMWAADDPLYFSHGLSAGNATKYRRLTDPFANQMFYHGHQARIGTFGARGTFLGSNRWGFQSAISGSNLWVLQGWACPIAAAASTYSITFTITYDAIGSDATRWAGAFIGMPTDIVYSDSAASTENGYQVWLRQNGSLNLVAKVAGVSGTTQTQSTAAITAGNTATIRIDVTPTTVTATRTDVSAPNTVTLTHSTNRGGYWHLGRNDNAGTSGLNVSFSNITIA